MRQQKLTSELFWIYVHICSIRKMLIWITLKVWSIMNLKRKIGLGSMRTSRENLSLSVSRMKYDSINIKSIIHFFIKIWRKIII